MTKFPKHQFCPVAKCQMAIFVQLWSYLQIIQLLAKADNLVITQLFKGSSRIFQDQIILVFLSNTYTCTRISLLHNDCQTRLAGITQWQNLPMFVHEQFAVYRKVVSSRLSPLVAHLRIFRLFMKGKFDAYVLWPFGPKVPKLNSSPTVRNLTAIC